MACILFIDDEITNTDSPDGNYMWYYQAALRESGYDLTSCGTNEEAISALKRERFDVIIQDIMRPPGRLLASGDAADGRRTGLVFYEKFLRETGIPTIFLTNCTSFSDRFPVPVFLKVNTPPFELVGIIKALLADRLSTLYDSKLPPHHDTTPAILSITTEVKQYFSKHPERLYNLNPRKFEELVADILADMGLYVHLTPSTRDSGVDIYAYIRHEVASFLMLVECKRWAADRPVGISIVQRLYGIQQAKHANKAMIVTTSYFSTIAKRDAANYKGLMDLIDFNRFKDWLSRYND